MQKQKLPFICFLDIDKTMIGRSHALTARFWLRRVIAELVDAGEVQVSLKTQKCPLSSDPDAHVGADLIRPRLGEALRLMKSASNNGIEFFVCSLGTRPNVAQCKVPGIEKCIGMRFNRPLFCTSVDGEVDNCNAATAPGNKKLVYQNFCTAIAVLAKRKKWAAALSKKGAMQHVFDKRFIMIDDTPDVALSDACNARIVTCTPYEHTPWVSATAGIPEELLRHPRVSSYLRANPPPRRDNNESRPAVSSNMSDDDWWPRFAQIFADAVRRGGSDEEGCISLDIVREARRIK